MLGHIGLLIKFCCVEPEGHRSMGLDPRRREYLKPAEEANGNRVQHESIDPGERRGLYPNKVSGVGVAELPPVSLLLRDRSLRLAFLACVDSFRLGARVRVELHR